MERKLKKTKLQTDKVNDFHSSTEAIERQAHHPSRFHSHANVWWMRLHGSVTVCLIIDRQWWITECWNNTELMRVLCYARLCQQGEWCNAWTEQNAWVREVERLCVWARAYVQDWSIPSKTHKIKFPYNLTASPLHNEGYTCSPILQFISKQVVVNTKVKHKRLKGKV